MKIVNIVGARPNFMKIAPVMEAYKAVPSIEPLLVHTGQHYDEKMSDLFFRQLGIPEPDINLEIGSGSHAVQTAEIMKAFEQVMLEHQPDAVLVVGDVNSTIGCGMVAKKMGADLIHVEAGLRSLDRSMPEEINRILTDSITDLFFCTEQSGVDHLTREGIPAERIHLVGNVMIDTLLRNREKAEASTILADQSLNAKQYGVVTLHRPSNVDDPETLRGIFDALEDIQKDVTLVFPMHPRTRANLQKFGLQDRVERMTNFRLMEPAGYLDFLKLVASARVVLTDSGGIQEETTILDVPCLTLRENTERPVTIECGTNVLTGTDPGAIVRAWEDVKAGRKGSGQTPPFWDGHAAERIVDVLAEVYGLSGAAAVT